MLWYIPYNKYPNHICQEAYNQVANHSPVHIAPDFDALYPTASAAATESAMNLVLTADLMVKRITTLLQPFDLTPASGLVLSILADSDGPVAPNQIADRLIISRATVTGLIDSLERRAYVTRSPSLTDRRMVLIEVTTKGRQVVQAFRPVVHQYEKAWFEVLSAQEQGQFIDMLHRLQARFHEAD